jgi:hypothetical protein
MPVPALRALATTTLVAALVTGGALTAHAATSTEVNVLTAATAKWSTSGALDLTWSWEDHRTGANDAPGAVLVYVGTGQVRNQPTTLNASGSGTYHGTVGATAAPDGLRVAIETYTCVQEGAGTSCSAPSLADAEWVVTLKPGQNASYARPTAPAPAPTTTTPAPAPTTGQPVAQTKDRTSLWASGVKRSHGKLSAAGNLVDRRTHHRLTASLQLQRRSADGWHTVQSVPTGPFTVTAPRATYRLHYAGTAATAASTSGGFTR